jgi:hypothetical protein
MGDEQGISILYFGTDVAVQHPSTPLAQEGRIGASKKKYGTWLASRVPHRNSSFIGILSGYCTVTLAVVAREIAPDWAVIIIEAVPRFGCVLLPHPPQPPITSPNAIIGAPAAAVSSEAGAMRTSLSRHIAKQNKANARRRAQRPSRSGITSP